MGIRERRVAERELLKKKICDAASDIILAEGFEKLSIRKIADRIEYSPGVIYNYFKDKKEIVKLIIAENIQRICDLMLSLKLELMEPKAALELGLRSFASAMLENRQQYKAIMLSGMNLSPFREDNTEINRLRELLIGVLDAGKASGVFDLQNDEIASMLLISAVFGLINTIVQEKIEDEQMQAMLIENHVSILVRGVSKQE
jgi:AcrR family transcriptional regulator